MRWSHREGRVHWQDQVGHGRRRLGVPQGGQVRPGLQEQGLRPGKVDLPRPALRNVQGFRQ